MRKALLLLGMSILFSFAFTEIEEKILGTWRVITFTDNKGETSKGVRTITISENHTLLSIKDNGRELKGKWLIRNDSLIISSYTNSSEESSEIITINEKELILKGKEGTVLLKKLNTQKSN